MKPLLTTKAFTNRKSRKSQNLVAAFETGYQWFKEQWFSAELLKLDNEISKALIEAIKENKLDYQLASPNDHRQNPAERAIQEMKDAGIDINKESEGLGDTIEKVLNKFGINQEKIEKILGGPGCGCTERKTWFNKIFSYKNKKEKVDG